MKLGPVGALVLSSAFMAASSRAQQWPTNDPSFSKPVESLISAPEAFGAPGQMVISGEFDIDLRYVSESAGGRSESGPNITISPSVMFFLAPQLAVGGLLGFHHEAAEDVSLSRFTFGPTVAYNFPVSERASLFPTVGILYGWAKSSSRTQGGRVSNSGYDIGLLLKAPFLFHPFRHVFVGFGPVIVLDFASKVDAGTATKTRSIGLTLDIGFWL